MSELGGKAKFECVEREFVFHPCLRQGNVEAPRLWQKIGSMKKRVGILMDFEDERAQQICSAMWAAMFWIMSHSKKKNLEQVSAYFFTVLLWLVLPFVSEL